MCGHDWGVNAVSPCHIGTLSLRLNVDTEPLTATGCLADILYSVGCLLYNMLLLRTKHAEL